MSRQSFTTFADLENINGDFSLTVPSALIADGPVFVPLYAVTQITLQESYHLPPIGSSGHRAIASTHDDSVTLSGMLVGPTRFAHKFALETLAESSKRGSFLQAKTRGKLTGLILVTSMTIRTDMQVKSLSFTASSQKRETLDVSISLEYMGRPSLFGKLLDVTSIGIGGLRDYAGA